MSESRQFSVGWDDADQRLDRWMRRKFPGLVQSRIERLCRKGQVRIDGSRAKPSDRLQAGQKIRLPSISFDSPESGQSDRSDSIAGSRREAGNLADRVLHADEHLLAIDKPEGLAVQGGTGQRRHIDAMGIQFGLGEGEIPKLVHRLDQGTSGVLLLARSRRAAAALSQLFRERCVRKIYWAVSCGSPRQERGAIVTRAGGEEVSARVEMLPWDAGRRTRASRHTALTNFAVLERLGQRFALLALNPVTGRSHQIRIHLAGVDAPIVGDRKYGGSGASNRGGIFRSKLHLHARSLEFRHPFTGELLRLAAPAPPHMSEAFDVLGWRPQDHDLYGLFPRPA